MSSENEFVLHSSNLPSKNFQFFDDMRRKGILCDIRFQIGEHFISAHRIVLAAGIPYFRDALYNNASAEVFETEIKMPKIHYTIFEALIEFVYTSKITITFVNAKDLLSAACALHVEEVKEACCEFLKGRLDPEVVLDIRHYAHNSKSLDLVEITDYYIRKNFDKVSQSESFLNLSFSFLEELIRKDDLQVSSEENVFESVIRWVNHSPTERCAVLPELLRNVRMTLLNPRYLTDYVGSQEFIRASIPCRDLLDEAKNYHFFPEKRQQTSLFCTEPRNFKNIQVNKISFMSNTAECSSDKQVVNGTKKKPRNKIKSKKLGICKIEAKTTFLVKNFDFERNEWHTCVSKATFHNEGSANVMNNKVYSVFEFLSVEYDLKNHDLQFFMGTERSHAGAAVLGGYLYVCGGMEPFATNLVEKYDPETKEWLEVPNMISCRISPGVVSFEGCIYVLGGKNRHNNILKSVEKYSVESEKWTPVQPMLIRRYALASAELNDKIYVCGGIGDGGFLNTAEMFEPLMKKWVFISSMNNSRYGFNLLPYCGKLYALGGYTNGTIPFSVVELYNPETNEWLLEPSMDSSIVSGATVIP